MSSIQAFVGFIHGGSHECAGRVAAFWFLFGIAVLNSFPY